LSWANFTKFQKNFLSGIDPGNNIVAQMASVSIFAFIDKEGIATESQKYIDEIVLINKKGEKQVLDMQHNALIKREDKIYEFEEKQKFKENIDSLKALGLAFMYAANPKLTDTENELHEMFVVDQLPIDVKKKTGRLHDAKPNQA
jgi:organic radical activating enzyme